MARRINLSQCRKVLDVGCGRFHWTMLLKDFFRNDVEIFGIDINPLSDGEVSTIGRENNVIIKFQKGSCEDMPFNDNTFDLVTCQTLLIHLENPLITIQEMKRVLKNNGTILISEPNNISQIIFRNSDNENEEIYDRMKKYLDSLKNEDGKIKSGQGNSSIGELVPKILIECGFRNVKNYLNDKVLSISPPYELPEQKRKIAMLEEIIASRSCSLSDTDKNEITKALIGIEAKRYWSFSPTMLFLSMGTKAG